MNYSELVTAIPNESREAYDARKVSASVLDGIYPRWDRLNTAWMSLLTTASFHNRRDADSSHCSEIANAATSAVSGMTLLISKLALFTLWHTPRYSRSHLEGPRRLRHNSLHSETHPDVASARSKIGQAREILDRTPPSELKGLASSVWLSGYAILKDLEDLLNTITNNPSYLDYLPGWAEHAE